MSTKKYSQEPSEAGNLGERVMANGQYVYKGKSAQMPPFFPTGRRYSEEQTYERKS